MKNKAITRITFVFADGSVFHLCEDETARDSIAQLKKSIEKNGNPVKTFTGIKIQVCNEE